MQAILRSLNHREKRVEVRTVRSSFRVAARGKNFSKSIRKYENGEEMMIRGGGEGVEIRRDGGQLFCIKRDYRILHTGYCILWN